MRCPSTGNWHSRNYPLTGHIADTLESTQLVESRCGAVAVGRTYLLPPLSSGGASLVPPWLRFHIPLIEPGHADLPHPALGQDFTPSPTARRAQVGTGVRARSARKGAGVERPRPCVA